MKKIAVVVATLMRKSLLTTTMSVQNQYIPDVSIQLMTRYDPQINEYASRDLAVKDSDADYLAFLDDDAFYTPDTLSKAYAHLQSNEFVDGVIAGNIFGNGAQIFDFPGLAVGTALFMTREAYDKAGGFRLDWGTEPGDGWRMDTALLYSFLKKNQGKGYKHAQDVVVNHPNMMQSEWSPYIEWQFYRDYTKYIEKYILAIDGRLPDMIKHADILDKAVKYLKKDEMNAIVKKHHGGIIVPEAYRELSMAIKAKEVKN